MIRISFAPTFTKRVFYFIIETALFIAGIWLGKIFDTTSTPFSQTMQLLIIMALVMLYAILLQRTEIVFSKKAFISFDSRGLEIHGKVRSIYSWAEIGSLRIYFNGVKIFLIISLLDNKEVKFELVEYWLFSTMNVALGSKFNYYKLMYLNRNIPDFFTVLDKASDEEFKREFKLH